MQSHRPILDLKIVFTMHQIHRSHQVMCRNAAGMISINRNKFNALNLFTKPTKRIFKPRLITCFSLFYGRSFVYVTKCRIFFIAFWTMQQLFYVVTIATENEWCTQRNERILSRVLSQRRRDFAGSTFCWQTWT